MDTQLSKRQLAPEAMALKIDALRLSGRTPEASDLACRFVDTYPTSPLVRSVRPACSR